MNSIRKALLAGAALLLAACGDDSLTLLDGSCEAPDGTLPFSFESGGRELFGFIDAPAAPGPHPAILLIHGAGRTDVAHGRGDFAALRETFRAEGIAAVVWDKAGSGCSGGRYGGLADLYLRADDALAAVDALRSHEDIDAGRLGAWATGEGAWVAPMAAAREDAFRYLILVGAPGRDPIHRIAYLVDSQLEREGYAADERAEVVERVRRALEMMRDHAPHREYRAVVDALSEYPLLPSLSEEAGDLFATQRRYEQLADSAALHVSADVFLPAVDVPVLAIWGERDERVDRQEALRVYREALAVAGNKALTTRVFEGADHRLCDAGATSRGNGGNCEPLQAYLDEMTGWLRSRGFTAEAGPRQTRSVAAAPQ